MGTHTRAARRIIAAVLPAVLAGACGESDDPSASIGRTDAGVAPVWVSAEDVPTDEQLMSVWGRAADDVWAVGWNGTVIHFDGMVWREETTTATVPLTGVAGLPLPADLGPDDPRPDPVVFATGWQGTLLERAPDGRWMPATVSATFSEDLFGLAVGAEDRGLAVGDSGRLVVWTGTTWTPRPLRVPSEFSEDLIEPKGTLQRTWTLDGSRFYVTGSGGAAYRSSDGLARFEVIDTRISDPLRGIWGTGNNSVYAVGLDGIILRFSGRQSQRVRNNGADELPAAFLFGVSGQNEDAIAVVGWRGTAIWFDGEAWAVEPTDVDADLRDVWVDTATNAAFAVGASGAVLKRDFSVAERPISP